MNETNQPQVAESQIHAGSLQELDVEEISSPTLARLIEEVRNEEEELTTHAYNRTHNRHNRSR